jgi:hypothetical protein
VARRRLSPEEELLRPTLVEYVLAGIVVVGWVVVIVLMIWAVAALMQIQWMSATD